MIRIQETSEGIIVHPIPESPIVYLDQCALNILAKDQSLGDRLISASTDKAGTLYLSITHMLTTGALDPRRTTYTQLRDFLDRIGPHWSVLESDAPTVIEREKQGVRAPQQDSEILKEIFRAPLNGRVPSAALAIEILIDTSELTDKYRDLNEEHKAAMKDMFERARRSYRSDPTAKRNLDGKIYTWSPDRPPTEFIYGTLMHETIKAGTFANNDGPDFEHAAVSTAYSDFVVLDTKWAERLGGMALPPRAAKVYAVTALDRFLGDFEAFQKS